MNDSKGHRSLWKVPHGWSRPGNWRHNKGASIVSVNLPYREGQFTTTTASGSVDAWKHELPSVLLCISRWLSACTWCISYPQEPQQSCLPAPLFSQSKTALEIKWFILQNMLLIWFKPVPLHGLRTIVKSLVFTQGCSFLCVALVFQISFQSEMIAFIGDLEYLFSHIPTSFIYSVIFYIYCYIHIYTHVCMCVYIQYVCVYVCLVLLFLW